MNHRAAGDRLGEANTRNNLGVVRCEFDHRVDDEAAERIGLRRVDHLPQQRAHFGLRVQVAVQK
ncbi:hypothetical protein, partial [Nocardia brasiliensis]|uniref:hypothetical protein n=1 Tax=Nocardia brasiliensis TaxID=37326 RepID=UPI0024570979